MIVKLAVLYYYGSNNPLATATVLFGMFFTAGANCFYVDKIKNLTKPFSRDHGCGGPQMEPHSLENASFVPVYIIVTAVDGT